MELQEAEGHALVHTVDLHILYLYVQSEAQPSLLYVYGAVVSGRHELYDVSGEMVLHSRLLLEAFQCYASHV